MVHQVVGYIPVEPGNDIAVIVLFVCIIAVVVARFKLLLVGLERVDNAVVKLSVGFVFVIPLPARVLTQQEVNLCDN